MQPLAQLFERLIVDGLYARCQRRFQSTQLQRHMVVLRTRGVISESASPRTCPCHVRFADPKAGSHLGNRAARIQHAIPQILPVGLPLMPCHDCASYRYRSGLILH